MYYRSRLFIVGFLIFWFVFISAQVECSLTNDESLCVIRQLKKKPKTVAHLFFDPKDYESSAEDILARLPSCASLPGLPIGYENELVFESKMCMHPKPYKIFRKDLVGDTVYRPTLLPNGLSGIDEIAVKMSPRLCTCEEKDNLPDMVEGKHEYNNFNAGEAIKEKYTDTIYPWIGTLRKEYLNFFFSVMRFAFPTNPEGFTYDYYSRCTDKEGCSQKDNLIGTYEEWAEKHYQVNGYAKEIFNLREIYNKCIPPNKQIAITSIFNTFQCENNNNETGKDFYISLVETPRSKLYTDYKDFLLSYNLSIPEYGYLLTPTVVRTVVITVCSLLFGLIIAHLIWNTDLLQFLYKKTAK